MSKHLFRYANQEAFDTDNDKLDELNHFTAYKEAEDEAEFKDWYIRPEFKPISESKAADICLVDNVGNKYIVDGTSYSTKIYPAEQYTPIGVVVVPGAHTEDGTARIISLKAMDYNTPDTGNESGNINIRWGGYRYSVPYLYSKKMFPCIAEDLRTIEGEQQIVNWYDITGVTEYLPSDHYTTYPNPYDEGTYYWSGTTSANTLKAMPSPYLTGGLKNEFYHSTANTGNVLADMDGMVNTARILAIDNTAGTDWQTADTITNTGITQTIHPAAQCCWRYHTTGTTQGEWYLPSAGELGYLAARWDAVEASFTKIRDNGFVAVLTRGNYIVLSSTVYSDLEAVALEFYYSGYAFLHYYTKYQDAFVRAFLAV